MAGKIIAASVLVANACKKSISVNEGDNDDDLIVWF